MCAIVLDLMGKHRFLFKFPTYIVVQHIVLCTYIPVNIVTCIMLKFRLKRGDCSRGYNPVANWSRRGYYILIITVCLMNCLYQECICIRIYMEHPPKNKS